MFSHHRPIYLGDTDAAGVLYFGSVFPICHQAYEASLAAAGVPLASLLQGELAVPIVRAEARFLRPLYCGDVCQVQVLPHSWQEQGFSVEYRLVLEGAESGDGLAAIATTQHCCIDPKTRQRQALPKAMAGWYRRWTAS
ncbi:MAG: thioesterase family protein [Cyanobacteria bacterium P01_A01_bin.135]